MSKKHNCQGFTWASDFLLHPGTPVCRSLTLIDCRIKLPRFRGHSLQGENTRCSIVYVLICCDTLTFPYRAYSIIQSVLFIAVFLKYTPSCTTQKCQPNNIPISVFASLIGNLGICILFSSFPFFGSPNASEC